MPMAAGVPVEELVPAPVGVVMAAALVGVVTAVVEERVAVVEAAGVVVGVRVPLQVALKWYSFLQEGKQ